MLPKILMLIIGLIYLDFAMWYSAVMHNIWCEEKDKRKFKGVLGKFWDWLDKKLDSKQI